MKVAHAVTVLGREISVRSAAPAERVQAVEAYVNSRLQEIGGALKSGDAQLVLTLTLLDTVGELLELRAERERDAEYDSRLAAVIRTLEAA